MGDVEGRNLCKGGYLQEFDLVVDVGVELADEFFDELEKRDDALMEGEFEEVGDEEAAHHETGVEGHVLSQD